MALTVLGLTLLALQAPSAQAEEPAEAKLRRRVQRFYVLNYLNRYEEMWDLFAPELQVRLGGDKQDYARSSRATGFELHASRIDRVLIDGAQATVDVRLHVELANALGATVRRHRMLWRHLNSDWRYLGSLDVTYEEQEGGADLGDSESLLPPPMVQTQTSDRGDELLPERRVLAPADAARQPPVTQPPGARGERWDLVAIPPPGQAPPPAQEPEAAGSQGPAGEPSATTPIVSQAPRTVDPRLAAAPSATPASDVALVALVRRCLRASFATRPRALAALAEHREPELVPLLLQGVRDAHPTVAAAFIDSVGRLGSRGNAAELAPWLRSDEPTVRLAAARAMGLLGDELQVPSLAAAFEHESSGSVRAELARALGRIGADGACALLAERLADGSESTDTRVAAARGVGAARCHVSAPALLQLVTARGPAELVLAAIEAAGRLGGAELIGALQGLANSKDELLVDGHGTRVALAARRALVAADVPGAGQLLAEAVLLEGPQASTVDVGRIAEAGDPRALLPLLAHPHPAIRRRAVDFAVRITDSPAFAEEAVQSLSEALLVEGDSAVLRAISEARSALDALRKKDSDVSP